MGRLQVSGKDGKQFLLNFYRYWYCLALFSLYRKINAYLCQKKKNPTPSLDKVTATESKASDLAKFLDPEKETLFCFDLL